MREYDLLAIAPLVPIQEARSRDDLDRIIAELRGSSEWQPDGRTIAEVRGEIDPDFINHSQHYLRMMQGGRRPDGSTYRGGGGLQSVRMQIGERTAEVVIAGSREWRPEAHSYLTRIRFANYPLIAGQPLTWTERARLLLRDDVRVHCSCPAFRYYHAHAATEKGFALLPEDRPASAINPAGRGGVCKHLEHALRYVAANYTTIAGAMKRHNQAEESVVTTVREPPFQRVALDMLEAELAIAAPLVESKLLTTVEVPKVRHAIDLAGYDSEKHGPVDREIHFFHHPDGTEKAYFADAVPASVQGQVLKPVKEKVYGTDQRWASRTTRRSAGADAPRRGRVVDVGHGERDIDFGRRDARGTLKVLTDVAQDLHPEMATHFKAAVKSNPELGERYKTDVASVGRPAMGPEWWHHPTVQHFLSTYDPKNHAKAEPAGAPVVKVKTRMPMPGLAQSLTADWEKRYKAANPDWHVGKGERGSPHAQYGQHRKTAVEQFNLAHQAVQYHMHQLLKDPSQIGKKSTNLSDPGDMTKDRGEEHNPNAGRRDPNWDREDFATWERVRRYLKSPAGASIVRMNAIPNKDGDVARALVHGLTHATVMEPDHTAPPKDDGSPVMRVKRDEAGVRVVQPRADAVSYWKSDVYNLRKQSLTRQRAAFRYDASGKRVLDVTDAPKPAQDYQFRKGGEFDQKPPQAVPADMVDRLKWRQEVLKQKDKTRAAVAQSMKNLAAAKRAASGRADRPVADMDDPFEGAKAADIADPFDAARTASPAPAPVVSVRTKDHEDRVRSLLGRLPYTGRHAGTQRLRAGHVDEPAKPAASPKDVSGLDTVSLDLPAAVKPKAAPKAKKLATLGAADDAAIDAYHAELRKEDPEISRPEAAALYRARKSKIKLESLPTAFRLRVLQEGVAEDFTNSLRLVLAQARKAGFSRTYAQLVQALNQATSEGGTASGTMVPADPRAPAPSMVNV